MFGFAFPFASSAAAVKAGQSGFLCIRLLASPSSPPFFRYDVAPHRPTKVLFT